MTGVSLAALLQVSLITAGADSYAEAHRTVSHTNRPMVVLVGAEWCGACEQMRKEVIPRVRKRGLLRRVAYAFVDLDRQRKLGRELTGDGLIPQVIMYRKTPDGWRRRRLVGKQEVKTIEAFINQGLALEEADKKTDPAPAKSEPATEAKKPTQDDLGFHKKGALSLARPLGYALR